jgi:hypothetical protein
MVKILFAALCIIIPLGAVAEERELIYTYLGPVAGGGMSQLTYSDWRNFYSKDKSSGYYANAGLAIWIVSKWLIGDFSAQYMYNNFKGMGIVHNTYLTMSGRIGVRLGTVGIFAPGIGMYVETPPTNRKFRGSAGLRAPLAFLFNTTFDTMLFIDGSFMYGWYGMGDRSVKMFYGVSLGFIFKIGRI